MLMHGNNQVMPIDVTLVPDTDDAVEMYQSHGGHITRDNRFGHDPLGTREDLMKIREERFYDQYPNFEETFHSVVNFDYSIFRSSLLYLIALSSQLEAQL